MAGLSPVRVVGSFVVITGASSGIGRALAFAFARRGCRLLLVGRDPARLAEVARRTSGQSAVVDLEDPARTDEFARELAELDPAPDLLVNNAGVGHVAPATVYDDATFARMSAVNLRAPMALSRAVIPGMLAKGGGHIGFVTSIAALLGVPNESGYAATKAGLHAYARSLREELATTGVGVSIVAPGIVDTEFFERRGAPYARRFPRPLPPERVAGALIRAIERDRAELILPRWLRVAVGLQALAPTLYARLAARQLT